jgi:putative DNA primase/helicase
VIAAVAIGDACPVITTTSREEMEKRLGSILLSGDQLVSLDNCTHDLAGELLCQVAERPVVKIRVLGQSQMPRCECRTTVFATGNNIALKGDMVRRGLVCNLDALAERPELRTFERDAIDLALDRRADYVAAALTVIRGYLAAGEPPVCGPIGSYAAWSRLVRSPLVWLGQPDPIKSMETAREDDPELADIREFFGLWQAYLDLDTDYTTARVIEVACAPPAPNDYNPPFFREFLLRVAANWKDRATVVPKRLGWWLRSISGRTVDEHRLIMSRLNKAQACFRLSKVQK